MSAFIRSLRCDIDCSVMTYTELSGRRVHFLRALLCSIDSAVIAPMTHTVCLLVGETEGFVITLHQLNIPMQYQ